MLFGLDGVVECFITLTLERLTYSKDSRCANQLGL